MYSTIMILVFTYITPLLPIFSPLPVTSATAKRSFSTLQRLKDWLRTTMKEEHLVSLALMSVQHELTDGLRAEKIVDNFAKKKKNRKLDFVLYKIQYSSYTSPCY